MLDQLWHEAGELDTDTRGAVLGRVFPHLPPHRRHTARLAMVDAARSATSDIDREFAVTRCVEVDPAPIDHDVALHLAEVALTIEDPRRRGNALAVCASALLRTAGVSPGAVWQLVRPGERMRRRAELLHGLRATASVLSTLGGEAAVVRLVQAVLDVARCWP